MKVNNVFYSVNMTGIGFQVKLHSVACKNLDHLLFLIENLRLEWVLTPS